MEPTGIEPVTSCLQSGTADPLWGLISRGLREIRVHALRRGYGWIGRDQARLGQQARVLSRRRHGRLTDGPTALLALEAGDWPCDPARRF
jgi:hypothetical protein